MSKHELKYQPVAAYKVGDKILTCVSSWNGLEELRDDIGRKLIVARDPGAGAYEKVFAGAFASLLPERECGRWSSMTIIPQRDDQPALSEHQLHSTHCRWAPAIALGLLTAPAVTQLRQPY